MSGLLYGIIWVLCNILSRVLLPISHHGERAYSSTRGGHICSQPCQLCGHSATRLWYTQEGDLFGDGPICFQTRLSIGCSVHLGWIPLRTDRLDRKAFGEAISCLKAGKTVVIFPEGTRTQDGHLTARKTGDRYNCG